MLLEHGIHRLSSFKADAGRTTRLWQSSGESVQRFLAPAKRSTTTDNTAAKAGPLGAWAGQKGRLFRRINTMTATRQRARRLTSKKRQTTDPNSETTYTIDSSSSHSQMKLLLLRLLLPLLMPSVLLLAARCFW